MLNFYQLLELPDFASADEVKKAYRARSLQYHPDRVSALGPKLKALAESEMAVINQAYEQLGDPARKQEFDAWLQRARDGKAFKSCARCGLQFAPEPSRDLYTLCPACRRFGQALDNAPANGRETRTRRSPESILRACFVVVHHFMSAAVVKRFQPTVECLVNGEKITIGGFPGNIELVFSNRDIYDAVFPDQATRKQPWNASAKLGKIIFNNTHPVAAAHTLWTFCEQALGSPRLDFARICINNDHFRPYEHVLNQTAVVTATGLSPWIAAKLYSRHNKNVAAAAADHEAALPDPFFNVLGALGPHSETVRADDIAHRAYALEERVHELSKKLLHTGNERDKAREQALGLSQMVEDLRHGMTVLQSENERIPWLQAQVIDLQARHEQAASHSGANRELLQQVDSLRQLNAWLQDQNRRIPGLERQILDLEKRAQELSAEIAVSQQVSASMDQIRDAVADTLEQRLSSLPAAPGLAELIQSLLKGNQSEPGKSAARQKAPAGKPTSKGKGPPPGKTV